MLHSAIPSKTFSQIVYVVLFYGNPVVQTRQLRIYSRV
jgi:hypothetical protein